MDVVASAPGKLVLLGEYAVLEGAPALVMAINRRARVRISAQPGAACEVSAPDLGIAACALRFDSVGMPDWSADADAGAKLRLVDQVIRGLAKDSLTLPAGRGFKLALDTAEFFDADSVARPKLGLGSSAALTVALASALAVFAGRGAVTANRKVWLDKLLVLHRDFQDGRGSGVDVAASLVGGLMSYRLRTAGAEPFCEALDWRPMSLKHLSIWSGKAASTSNLLGALAQWRQSHEAEYQAHMKALTVIAGVSRQAVLDQRGDRLLEAVTGYAGELREFSAATGLQIFSPEHEQLTKLAAQSGVCYKSCGAGGGDFGIALTPDAERLADARKRIVAAGFRCPPLSCDEQGLHLDY
ncbi:MAG: hypothetical protein AABY95_00850 [Pseudomonadota bacterium]